ncbi:MAG: guanylate kinase, partial [Deltaproteobacteria bacterium]|nr:guanylate kinase [Deltaproteobacteria bacterium]
HYGNLYGTSRSAVQDMFSRGKDVIFDVEPRGARSLKPVLSGRGFFVFIMPPSLEALQQRLTNRATEGKEQREKRLAQAFNEMNEAKWYDRLVINDNFEQALLDLETIYLSLKG